MPSRRLRVAVTAALVAPVVVGPVMASAVSGPLSCRGVTQSGPWQRVPVDEFKGVPSVRTGSAVTAYSLEAGRPQRLLATNGNTIQVTDNDGCTWREGLVLGLQGDRGVPLSGNVATIVATASLPGGRSLAAIREGTSAASRPHVASSPDGNDGTWRESSEGLPEQGSPRLLEPADDGRTAYLTLSSTSEGDDDGTLPTLPGVGGGAADSAGLLYATIDGGRTWALRTSAAALPSGVTGFDSLAVDPADPDLLYALSDGKLVISRDGGRTLLVQPDVARATAVEPMGPGEVAVLAGTVLLHSRDGGETFVERAAPAGATSAAYRTGDGALVVEADGVLFRVQARAQSNVVRVDAGVRATTGSARGDRAPGGSFHALAGNTLLRYVDPRPAPRVEVPPAPGDQGVPPPPRGRMEPPSRSVTLPVGDSRLVDFTLVLPKSPTPLDLYLLLDTSRSMRKVLEDLKRNLLAATSAIAADGVDLRVGVGTIGIGPRPGELPYPEVDPKPDYRKPVPYSRVRPVGRVDAELAAALAGVRLTTPPTQRGQDTAEGQLLSLQQLATGTGIVSEQSVGPVPQYLVAPRQQAGFRDAPEVRRIVVHATNEAFQDPYGTPLTLTGELDTGGVARLLKAKGIAHVGLAVVTSDAQDLGEARPDLRLMAQLTGTLAPAGGVDCGDGIRLPQGAPLVCDTSRNFSQVLSRVVRGLADRQSVALVPKGPRSLVGDLDASRLRDLDVTARNEVPFQVRVSCVDVAAGAYSPAVDAVLRGRVVASAKLAVTCTAPAVAAVVPPPKPPPAQLQDPAPAGQPAAQAPAPPAPAPPVVQPQAQPQAQAQTQVQAQVNPVTAAMLQQQEELQLALALLADEKPSPGNQLAMVDRRRREELRALALLAVSMAGASAVGLARLRTRRADAVRVGRAR